MNSLNSSNQGIRCWDIGKKAAVELPFSEEVQQRSSSSRLRINYTITLSDKGVPALAFMRFTHEPREKSFFVSQLRNNYRSHFRGVGRGLLQRAIKISVSQNIRLFHLEATESSHLFYAKLGFFPYAKEGSLVFLDEYKAIFAKLKKELQDQEFKNLLVAYANDNEMLRILNEIKNRAVELKLPEQYLIWEPVKFFPEYCEEEKMHFGKKIRRLIELEKKNATRPKSSHLGHVHMCLTPRSTKLWKKIIAAENDEKRVKQLNAKLQRVSYNAYEAIGLPS